MTPIPGRRNAGERHARRGVTAVRPFHCSHFCEPPSESGSPSRVSPPRDASTRTTPTSVGTVPKSLLPIRQVWVLVLKPCESFHCWFKGLVQGRSLLFLGLPGHGHVNHHKRAHSCVLLTADGSEVASVAICGSLWSFRVALPIGGWSAGFYWPGRALEAFTLVVE